MNKTIDVVYISFTNKSHVGVRNKIFAQINAWEKDGVVVKHVGCYEGHFFLAALWRYYIFILYFIFRKDSSAVIYLRQTLSLPLFSFMARFRTFCYEVNSKPEEERKNLIWYKKLLHNIFEDRLILQASHVFYVSEELRAYFHDIDHKKSSIFPNSIFRIIQKKESLPRQNNVVFVGSDIHSWQGVDILYLIASQMADYKFNLIGQFNYKTDLKNVVYHGVLIGGDYDTLMSGMDYAIGTLAFHRSGLSEGSPLKVRDYLSYDLPTVVGYRDSDFFEESFMKYIDPCDLSSVVDSIRVFFLEWRNDSFAGSIHSSCLFEVREKHRVRKLLQLR